MKKSLTPPGRRGKVIPQEGKGATEQRNYPGEQETLTGDNSFSRASGMYPKPPPEPPPAPSMPTGEVPPRLGLGIPDEEV